MDILGMLSTDGLNILINKFKAEEEKRKQSADLNLIKEMEDIVNNRTF